MYFSDIFKHEKINAKNPNIMKIIHNDMHVSYLGGYEGAGSYIMVTI